MQMQHTGPKEGLKEGQNVDEECADDQHCMRDASSNIKTLDTKKHHTGTKAVQFKLNLLINSP